jgi:hypothetical protein
MTAGSRIITAPLLGIVLGLHASNGMEGVARAWAVALGTAIGTDWLQNVSISKYTEIPAKNQIKRYSGHELCLAVVMVEALV